MTTPGPTRRRETLEERVERLDVKQRDCRTCPMFTRSPTGLAFGWCEAHKQYVKLYHGSFWSQCQFKTLSRAGTTHGDSDPAGEPSVA
jgi:hypothetical protein